MHITGLYIFDVPDNMTSSKSSVLKYLIMGEEYLWPDKILLSTGRRVGCRKKSKIQRMDYICSVICVDATIIHTCVALEHQVLVEVIT